MTGIESLSRIHDLTFVDNIKEMTECFVSQINPLKVILFGSFADGSYTEDSDYDFFLVLDYDKVTLVELGSFISELEDALGKHVDFAYDSASEEFKAIIRDDMRLVYG